MKRVSVLFLLVTAAFAQTRSRLAEYALVLEDPPVAQKVQSRVALQGAEAQAHLQKVRVPPARGFAPRGSSVSAPAPRYSEGLRATGPFELPAGLRGPEQTQPDGCVSARTPRLPTVRGQKCDSWRLLGTSTGRSLTVAARMGASRLEIEGLRRQSEPRP